MPSPEDQESQSKSIEPTQENNELEFVNQLTKMVAGELELHLGTGEYKRTINQARKVAIVEPQLMKMCSVECPMRDMCPLVQGQDESTHPDKLGLRCPVEAEYWKLMFEQTVQFIRSKDPDDNDLSKLELGLCKELAYRLVLKHRALTELSQSPNTIIDAVVPGTDGATAEQENPRLVAYERLSVHADKALDRLNKIVDTRLKDKRDETQRYFDTIASVHKDIHDNPEKYAGTQLASVMTNLKKRVDVNQEKRKARYESSDGNTSN